jgi:hypothetical protein
MPRCMSMPLPGLGPVIVCGGRRAQRCTYCGASAERLCDSRVTRRNGRLLKKPGTCDVPMCSACTFRPEGTEADYCRDHLL